jgi:hypothetical protein
MNLSMVHQKNEHRLRSFEFWGRAGAIYAGYKIAQAKASWLRLRGYSEDYINETHWLSQSDTAGREIYELCVDMRGFFIKVRGARFKLDKRFHAVVSGVLFLQGASSTKT